MSLRDWYDNNAIWVAIPVLMAAIIPSSIWLGYRLNYDRVYEEYATNQAYSEAKKEFESRCTVLSAREEILDCFRDSVKSARETQRSEEDLKAQRQMSAWALALLVVSSILGFFSLIAAAVGVFLVRNTLQASVEANELTREEQRAWLKVKLDKAKVIRPFANHKIGLQYFIRIDNAGTRPAVDVKTKQYVFYGRYMGVYRYATDEYIEKFETIYSGNGGQTIFPSDNHSMNIKNYTTIENDEFGGKDEIHIFLISIVRYRSAGDKRARYTSNIYQVDTSAIGSKRSILPRLGDLQRIT